MDLNTATAFMTDLVNNNLTRSSWLGEGDYLKSYTINFYDKSYRQHLSPPTTNYSVYYSPVLKSTALDEFKLSIFIF